MAPDVSSRGMRKVDLNAFKALVGALQLDSSYPHSYREVLLTLGHTADQGGEATTKMCRTAVEKVRTYCAQANLHPPPREGEETLPAGKIELCVRSRAVVLARISSTSQTSCRARRRTAPYQAPSPLIIYQRPRG